MIEAIIIAIMIFEMIVFQINLIFTLFFIIIYSFISVLGSIFWDESLWSGLRLGPTWPRMATHEKILCMVNLKNVIFDSKFELSIQLFKNLLIKSPSLFYPRSRAVPDQRALNIVKEFSPLVEIGAGNG